jgi:sialate O-acetylesterase
MGIACGFTPPKWQAADAAWVKEFGGANDAAVKKWTADAAAAQAAGQPIPPRPVPATPRPRKPASPEQNPNTPTVLTNGMVALIVPYAIKGAIWYQGESNAGAAKVYQTLFPTMITDWRTRWG